MRLFLKLALIASVFMIATAARAQDYDGDQPPPPQGEYAQYGYMGAHPIPYDVGGGYCYQQGAHFHEYAPFDRYLFREYGGWFYFVGDPGDFGYAQQMWGFSGHHPIPLAYGGGYCFMDWPHRHHYPPPYGALYNYVGGYYVYGGPWDPWYWRWRPYYANYYSGYYRQSYYGGIYFSVRPAPIYRAAITVGAPGYYRAGAVVAAPGGGRVVVGAPRPVNGVVVGAPRPVNGVVVGAPRPVNGVVVGAPAPGYRGMATPEHPGYRGVAAPQTYRPAPPPPAYQYHAAPSAYRAVPSSYHAAPPAQFHASPHAAFHR